MQMLYGLLRTKLTDRNLIFGLVALSVLVALSFFWDHRAIFFYQNYMKPAAMFACGLGWSEPAVVPQALTDFLRLQVDTFDCAQLAGVEALTIPNNFFAMHLYLAGTAGLLWRVFGVNYLALLPLIVAVNVAWSLGCYRLARLWFSPRIAVFLAVLATLSPIAIAALLHFRDYVKAPFVIWALVLAVQTLRERRPLPVLGSAAACGAVIGLGLGFRLDLLTFAPMMLAAIVGFASFEKRRWWHRPGLALCYCLGFIALSLPVLLSNTSSTGGIFALQGASAPFQRFLGLGTPGYDLGGAYSDELTMSAIAAELRSVDAAGYDAAEGRPISDVSQSLSRSSGSYLNYAVHFPADVLVRAYKSALLLAGYFPVVGPENRLLDPNQWTPIPGRSLIANITAPLWNLLANPVLYVIGSLGLLSLLTLALQRSWREGLALTLLLGAMLALPSLQFSIRHFLHYEILTWLFLAALAKVVRQPAVYVTGLRRSGLVVGTVVILCAGGWAGAAAVQQNRLTGELRELIASASENIPVAEDAHGLIAVAPTEHAAIINSPRDSLSATDMVGGGIAAPWDVRAEYDRLMVAFRSDCIVDEQTITLHYAKTSETHQPMDRTIVLAGHEDRPVEMFIFPAFYRPSQHFAGIEMSVAARSCVASVVKLGPSSLPAQFSIALAKDWEQDALYYRLF